MREISSFHQEVEGHIDTHESMGWDTWPWTLGGYGDLAPMDLTDYYADAARPAGRIYFAGEHISPFPGWIQGAVYSALLAVKDIVTCLLYTSPSPRDRG